MTMNPYTHTILMDHAVKEQIVLHRRTVSNCKLYSVLHPVPLLTLEGYNIAADLILDEGYDMAQAIREAAQMGYAK